jgi:hypothetical protein
MQPFAALAGNRQLATSILRHPHFRQIIAGNGHRVRKTACGTIVTDLATYGDESGSWRVFLA